MDFTHATPAVLEESGFQFVIEDGLVGGVPIPAFFDQVGEFATVQFTDVQQNNSITPATFNAEVTITALGDFDGDADVQDIAFTLNPNTFRSENQGGVGYDATSVSTMQLRITGIFNPFDGIFALVNPREILPELVVDDNAGQKDLTYNFVQDTTIEGINSVLLSGSIVVIRAKDNQIGQGYSNDDFVAIYPDGFAENVPFNEQLEIFFVNRVATTENLVELNLSNNTGLTDKIPSNFVNLAQLENFNFSNTNLCPQASQTFVDWTNQLTSYIPSSIECNRPFITTWRTTEANESITIPVGFQGNVDYNVDWGDGSPVERFQFQQATHSYAEPGVYTVSITGDFPSIRFSFTSDNSNNNRLLTIEQWGDITWKTMASAFINCRNLSIPAEDAPNLSQVETISAMFLEARSFNSSINHWNVSNVKDMSSMFSFALAFNQPLDNWNVSNVTDMSNMFSNARTFNQNINAWEVSNVY